MKPRGLQLVALLEGGVCDDQIELRARVEQAVAVDMGRLKTRDWKTRDHFTGVKNARLIAMERQSYK